MHPRQIPKADSKNRNTRQIRHITPVTGLYELIITKKKNIVAESAKPIIQANFFCLAPTYSGTWLLTIKRPIINVGENLGLIKTRIRKSVRKKVMTYFIARKLFSNRIRIREMNTAKNIIPADALISLSFKTGILYCSTSSPNCIILSIFLLSDYLEY